MKQKILLLAVFLMGMCGMTYAQTTGEFFKYANGTTNIVSMEEFEKQYDGSIYNLQGMKVNEGYKGVVIKNGKKVINK